MGTRVAVIAGALAVLTAGCATQADIQAVQREQRRLGGRLADTRASLEATQRDIAKLRGRIDEVRHVSGGPRRSDRLEQLEARLGRLESGAVPPAVPSEETPTGEPGATEPGTAVPGANTEPAPESTAVPATEAADDAPEEYRKGLQAVRGGEYDRAIQSFRGFLRTDGDSSLAPNAHYWIGDSYFMLGDYYQAILNFNDVRQRYPTSDRAPAAVLKIGMAFLKMGNKTEARLAFQKVVKDYPASPEAGKAKEQLRALPG